MIKSFQKMLEESRKTKRITLRKLSQLVGLSPSFLSDMENGRRNPPTEKEKIKDLALVLGIEPHDLMKAAKLERMKSSDNLFKQLFNKDGELAWGFCRAVEDSSEDDLKTAIKQFVESLNKKKGGL